jgi:hypothetical protein
MDANPGPVDLDQAIAGRLNGIGWCAIGDMGNPLTTPIRILWLTFWSQRKVSLGR